MEKKIHGFRLVRERELTDTKGTLYEFIHEKTVMNQIYECAGNCNFEAENIVKNCKKHQLK